MRPPPPDLRTLTTTRGLVQWVTRHRAAPPRLHAVGAGGLTACRVPIPSHAVTTPSPNARPCGNCASHLTGVWRTGRPRSVGPVGTMRLPTLSSSTGRQELLDTAVEELAPALGIPARKLGELPPAVVSGRDLMLAPRGADDPLVGHPAAVALRKAYRRHTGLPVPCDPDTLDAWVDAADGTSRACGHPYERKHCRHRVPALPAGRPVRAGAVLRRGGGPDGRHRVPLVHLAEQGARRSRSHGRPGRVDALRSVRRDGHPTGAKDRCCVKPPRVADLFLPLTELLTHPVSIDPCPRMLPDNFGEVSVRLVEEHTVELDARGPYIPFDGHLRCFGCSESWAVVQLAMFVAPRAIILDALRRLCDKVGLRMDELPVTDIVTAVLQRREGVFRASPAKAPAEVPP